MEHSDAGTFLTEYGIYGKADLEFFNKSIKRQDVFSLARESSRLVRCFRYLKILVQNF